MKHRLHCRTSSGDPGKRHGIIVLPTSMALGVCLLAGFARAVADELDVYAAEQQRLIDDSSRPIGERAKIAINLAGALDRSAQSASTADGRRRRWSQARSVLDEFNRNNPGHASSDPFILQSAVYRWAEAQSWTRQAELDPADAAARARALRALDDSIERLATLADRVARRGPDPSIALNTRYRLARALEDRARLQDDAASGSRADRDKALEWLSPAIEDRSLKARAALLRAELLNGLGRYPEALAALKVAEKAQPPAPIVELLPIRIDALIGFKKPGEAWAALEASNLDDGANDILAIRVRLAQRRDLSPGRDRVEIEQDLFRRADALRNANTPEGRVELRRLAREVSEPDPALGSGAWDTLADGQLALGSPSEAARLAVKGAKRADAEKHPEAAAQLRYRAGAILFQAGKFREADEILTGLADDPGVGGLRPRAGLLRALTRARATATKVAGFTQEGYVRALETQIRDFPGDPSASEARWLLGLARLAAGDRPAASALWKAIPRNQPRGLDARIALFKLLEDEIKLLQIGGDPVETRKTMDGARADLIKLRDGSPNLTDHAAVELARASLELIPGLGRPSEARKACEQALSLPHGADLERQARLLQITALIQEQRYSDAEKLSRDHLPAFSTAELLALAARLDRLASVGGNSDADQRRIGQVLRTLLKPLIASLARLNPDDQLEAQFRQARAVFFNGDPAAAAASLSALPRDRFSGDLRLLRELADLEERLRLDRQAIETYRLLASRLNPGTLPWFDARHGQAAALSRSHQRVAARRLIEATSLLHPALGGPVMKARFDKLRTSLDSS
jgi:hypothetical protein